MDTSKIAVVEEAKKVSRNPQQIAGDVMGEVSGKSVAVA